MQLSHQLKSVMLFTFDHKTRIIKTAYFVNKLFLQKLTILQEVSFYLLFLTIPQRVHHLPGSS